MWRSQVCSSSTKLYQEKNVKVTGLLKLYKTVPREEIVAQIQRVFKGRCSEIAIKSCSAVM